MQGNHRAKIILLAAALSASAAHAQNDRGPLRGPVPVTDESPPAEGYRVRTVLDGLDHPWAIQWLPDGRRLITERPGRLLISDPAKPAGRWVYVDGLPQDAILPVGQGGLMDLALHPDFVDNNLVYFTHATGTPRANRTALTRGRLVLDDPDNPRLEDVQTIFRVSQAKRGGQHFGSRLLWLPDGTLLMSTGDGGNPPIRLDGDWIRENAQNLASHLGKTLRMTEDGKPAADNPFADRDDEGAYVYTYGHRNIQGLALDPASGRVWATEHGARGGDELNLLEAGENYGWPKATYSREYRGPRISEHTSLPGMVDPRVVWTPSIAASGLVLYTGDKLPQWRGDLLAGGLVLEQVRVVDLDGAEVRGERTIQLDQRVRDVRQGPDGYVYILTDEQQGALLRLEPTPGEDQGQRDR